MPTLKHVELHELGYSGERVKCSWCRKDIELDALCCPYCRNDGPSMPWKKTLKHFSFVFRPGKHKKTRLDFILSVIWFDPCGQKFAKSFYFSCRGNELNGTTNYFTEIDIPADASIRVSLYSWALHPDGTPSNNETLCHPKNGLEEIILHDPGKYMVTMFMEAERRLLTTRYTPFFSVERIG